MLAIPERTNFFLQTLQGTVCLEIQQLYIVGARWKKFRKIAFQSYIFVPIFRSEFASRQLRKLFVGCEHSRWKGRKDNENIKEELKLLTKENEKKRRY